MKFVPIALHGCIPRNMPIVIHHSFGLSYNKLHASDIILNAPSAPQRIYFYQGEARASLL